MACLAGQLSPGFRARGQKPCVSFTPSSSSFLTPKVFVYFYRGHLYEVGRIPLVCCIGRALPRYCFLGFYKWLLKVHMESEYWKIMGCCSLELNTGHGLSHRLQSLCTFSWSSVGLFIPLSHQENVGTKRKEVKRPTDPYTSCHFRLCKWKTKITWHKETHILKILGRYHGRGLFLKSSWIS